MTTPSDTARWATIATALSSPPIRAQSQVWELERRQMLEIVTLFWTAESIGFKNFVENPANSQTVSAMVLTALEDTPENFVGVLMGVCCPELLDGEALIGPTALPSLFEMLVKNQEKGPLDADASFIAAELPPSAMKLLHLARANALLNFLQNILLIYQQVDDSVPHLDFEKGS